MTKIICVNNFVISGTYAFWFGITGLLILGLGASYSELSTAHFKPSGFLDHQIFCYNEAVSNKEVCSPYVYAESGNTIENRLSMFSILLVIDFIIIGIWIYSKQQKFKLSWCNTSQQKSIGDKN